MNALEMTDSELYEMGFKVLADKLGASEVPRFVQQCKPGTGDYSVDRHKLLANEPDIETIVKRIQDRQPIREAEERARAKRFAAPQHEIQNMTDLEVFEIGNQILIDRLGVDGFIRFTWHCQELNGGHPRDLIENEKDAKERIKLYTAGLTLNPRTVETYIRRGNAYSYIREYDKAINDYSEAIKIRPDYADAYYNRGRLYAEGDAYDKAIADFSTTIKFDPEHANAYGYRADLYRDKGEYDKAIEDYSVEINLRPDDAESYYDRGTVYAKKGEYDKAAKDFSKAIELIPTFTEAYAKRALTYSHLGEFELAVQDYNRC